MSQVLNPAGEGQGIIHPPRPPSASARISSSQFWRQVRTLTAANMKTRYRKTVAGFIWVVVNPLFMYGVQSLVFKTFLKLQIPNYGLFLLSGLLPWIFIVGSVEMSTTTLMNAGKLLKSFPVNPIVYLMALLLDNLANFFAAFLLVLIPVWLSTYPGGTGNSVGLLALPIALGLVAFGVFGMGWLLAALQVFYRDTKFVISFAISISFFLTPVFYPIEYVPEAYRWLVEFNPFYRLIWPFRVAIYEFGWVEFARAAGLSALTGLIFNTVAFAFWKKRRNDVFFYV